MVLVGSYFGTKRLRLRLTEIVMIEYDTQSYMSLRERATSWLEPSALGQYQCSHCEIRFEDAHLTCPECDRELRADEALAYYWGPV